MSEPTPRPWEVYERVDGALCVGSVPEPAYGMAAMITDAAEYATARELANAEHIVRCVNAHAELIAALEESRTGWLSIYPDLFPKPGHFGLTNPGPECSCVICVIDTALQKARGERP